jgi:hypothetical protein
MRASEIRVGETYAATGRDLQLSKVRVLNVVRNPRERSVHFECDVVEGEVYVGWSTLAGVLDMDYVGPGTVVMLQPRDFLRPWEQEEQRRSVVLARRGEIRDLMTEADALLNHLGLPDAQIQLIEIRGKYTVVAVLGLEDIRRLHAQYRASVEGPAEPNT